MSKTKRPILESLVKEITDEISDNQLAQLQEYMDTQPMELLEEINKVTKQRIPELFEKGDEE
jgi:hypothetical protein